MLLCHVLRQAAEGEEKHDGPMQIGGIFIAPESLRSSAINEVARHVTGCRRTASYRGTTTPARRDRPRTLMKPLMTFLELQPPRLLTYWGEALDASKNGLANLHIEDRRLD